MRRIVCSATVSGRSNGDFDAIYWEFLFALFFTTAEVAERQTR
jgi:hypothetical protein